MRHRPTWSSRTELLKVGRSRRIRIVGSGSVECAINWLRSDWRVVPQLQAGVRVIQSGADRPQNTGGFAQTEPGDPGDSLLQPREGRPRTQHDPTMPIGTRVLRDNDNARHSTPLIFITYRDSDEPWAAWSLDEELSKRLGKDAVFLDTRSIQLGATFDRTLLDAVRNAAVLLVVIGSRWLHADADGIRQVDQPDDWVRREIVVAITTGTIVIPVLVGDVSALRAEELPTNIRRLARYQSVRLRHRDAPRDLAHIVDVVCDAIDIPPSTGT